MQEQFGPAGSQEIATGFPLSSPGIPPSGLFLQRCRGLLLVECCFDEGEVVEESLDVGAGDGAGGEAYFCGDSRGDGEAIAGGLPVVFGWWAALPFFECLLGGVHGSFPSRWSADGEVAFPFPFLAGAHVHAEVCGDFLP